MKRSTVISTVLAMVAVIGLSVHPAGAVTDEVDPSSDVVYPMSHPYYTPPAATQIRPAAAETSGEAVYPMSHPYYTPPASAQAIQTETEPVGKTIYPMSHPYYTPPAS
jgi:hypothetical protein